MVSDEKYVIQWMRSIAKQKWQKSRWTEDRNYTIWTAERKWFKKIEQRLRDFWKTKDLVFMSSKSKKEKRKQNTENLLEGEKKVWKFPKFSRRHKLTDVRSTTNLPKDKLKEIHTQTWCNDCKLKKEHGTRRGCISLEPEYH